jgi:hypothetical protein
MSVSVSVCVAQALAWHIAIVRWISTSARVADQRLLWEFLVERKSLTPVRTSCGANLWREGALSLIDTRI